MQCTWGKTSLLFCTLIASYSRINILFIFFRWEMDQDCSLLQHPSRMKSLCCLPIVPYQNQLLTQMPLKTHLKFLEEISPPAMPPFHSKLVSPGRGAHNATASSNNIQWHPVKVSTLAIPRKQDTQNKQFPKRTNSPRIPDPQASQKQATLDMPPPAKTESTN